MLKKVAWAMVPLVVLVLSLVVLTSIFGAGESTVSVEDFTPDVLQACGGNVEVAWVPIDQWPMRTGGYTRAVVFTPIGDCSWLPGLYCVFQKNGSAGGLFCVEIE